MRVHVIISDVSGRPFAVGCMEEGLVRRAEKELGREIGETRRVVVTLDRPAPLATEAVVTPRALSKGAIDLLTFMGKPENSTAVREAIAAILVMCPPEAWADLEREMARLREVANDDKGIT